MKRIIVVFLSGIAALLLTIWATLYLKGRQFAMRDPLKKADAIVVLAGTRGNLKFLDGKIQTAVRLYRKGYAPHVICSGKFSVKVTDTPTLIEMAELRLAATGGRIQEKDIGPAIKLWDIALGASYMANQAIRMGVMPDAILLEKESLHTRENAEMVLEIVKQHGMKRIILVTSPFHQRRTYLTFAKVFQPYNIEIINYYADTGEWYPLIWFISKEHRVLVHSENERIKKYRKKGDLL